MKQQQYIMVNWMNKEFEVAVLIAVYNGEQYLEELLDSLQQQTYRDFVCYVHDDGSADKSMEIIKKYQYESKLHLNVLEYPPTGSAKANFMSLVEYAVEPYLMFCDQDDVWLPQKIEESVCRIKKLENTNANPALVFSDMKVVNDKLDVIAESFLAYTGLDSKRITPQNLMLENVIAGCSMIMNRSLYKMSSQIKNIDNVNIHDHFFALLASCTGSIDFIEKPLLLYRQHSNNVKGAKMKSSVIRRVYNNFGNMVAKQYKSRFQEWMTRLQRQAGEIADIEEVRKPYKKICEEFSSISEKNKFQRIAFYLKNHILRKKYNLWFLMWC